MKVKENKCHKCHFYNSGAGVYEGRPSCDLHSFREDCDDFIHKNAEIEYRLWCIDHTFKDFEKDIKDMIKEYKNLINLHLNLLKKKIKEKRETELI